MKTSDVVGLCASFAIFGWAFGIITNSDISYYAGKLNAHQEAKEEARRWARDELMSHCTAWHTDRRKNDYMACKQPEWMHK